MTEHERIAEIKSSGMFNDTEVVKEGEINDHLFSSIEYYLIVHYTNEELYYLDEESEKQYKIADTIEDTPKGRIYCFK